MVSDTEKMNDTELRSLAEALGLAFLEEIPDDAFSPELTARLPVAWARAQHVLPIVLDGVPSLLSADPADLESQQRASSMTGATLRPVIAPKEVVSAAIERCYAVSSGNADAGSFIQGLSEQRRANDKTRAPDGGDEEPIALAPAVNDLLDDAETAPVTKLVNLILLEAVKQRASDIHFEPFSGRLAVRYRIDGVLYNRAEPPKRMEAALVSRLKVMAGMDISEKRLPQDGMARARLGNREVDIRVSTVPVADGERVVLRLLNRDDTCRPMTSLGMDDTMLDSFRPLLRMPNGIIIVSGPTGSGKTTTLYSALGVIDAKHRNILTIEDPVEYRLPDIGQIQVKPKIGLTFASGLRHILRQDPDVVLVGETRDSETAEIAVRAALTGHLVFTTLHTNDAPSAIMRLVDMGIEPYLLASCLRGVLGQRLVRTLCPRCSRETTLAEASAGLVLPSDWRDRLSGAPLHRATGCDACLEGYSGRVGLFELMVCTPALTAAIRHGCTGEDDFRKAAIDAGMRTMADDAIAKITRGVTDLAEVATVLAL